MLKIAPQAISQVQNVLVQYFSLLNIEKVPTQSKFDCLFADAVQQMRAIVRKHSPSTSFSFGRAQKIINIVTKYCYVWWPCNDEPSPMFGDMSWIDKWQPFLHVPVDRKVMEHLKSVKRLNGPIVSWKWGMTERQYLNIQDIVRDLAIKQGVDPICYEMKNIWQTN